MSQPPTQPQQQPQLHQTKPPPTSFPDFIFTALSLFFIYSSPSPRKLSLNPRRFLKIPIMSQPTKLHHPTRPFPTPQSLSDWLTPRLPSGTFSLWGVKPGTKNVNNLWLELTQGETSLADTTPPVRTLEVVVVRIINQHTTTNNKILVESHQELSNGSIRHRHRPLSEKMKPGETLDDAVLRAVKEELGSVLTNVVVRILPYSYSKKVEERVSVSYPGLPACYVLHTVEAVVDGLPEGEFCTEESDEYAGCGDKEVMDGAVSCRKHYWKWVDSDSL